MSELRFRTSASPIPPLHDFIFAERENFLSLLHGVFWGAGAVELAGKQVARRRTTNFTFEVTAEEAEPSTKRRKVSGLVRRLSIAEWICGLDMLR